MFCGGNDDFGLGGGRRTLLHGEITLGTCCVRTGFFSSDRSDKQPSMFIKAQRG